MTRNRDSRGAAPRRPDPRKGAAKPPRRVHEGGSASDVVRIYGFHSVEAALKAPRRELVRLYATEAAVERLGAAIAARGVELRVVAGEEIAARLPRDAVHQGVLLEARPLAPIDLSDLPENGLILVLDQITDPHNVGAILRTAAAFGVDALVTTERHSPELSGALAKSASGGLEFVAVATETNLARALTEIGDMGYLRIGLDFGGVGFDRRHADRPSAGARARRRGQGFAAPDPRALRRDGAARPAGGDQEPQRLERRRDCARARERTPQALNRRRAAPFSK